MSYYVIIRGPAGVGKSTIAKEVARILGGVYLSIDRVLEENGLDKIPEGADGIPAENFIKGNEAALQRVAPLMMMGLPAIFDGNFYRKAQYEHLLKKLGAKGCVFTLTAPLAACVTRDAGREKPIGVDSVQAVYHLAQALDVGVKIKADERTIAQVRDEMLEHIRVMMKR